MILRDGVVLSVRTFDNTQEAAVRVTKTPPNTDLFPIDTELKVLIYPQMIGKVQVGSQLRFDCSPLAAGLGTGGYAMATAVWDLLPPDRLPDNHGHIMKARYTPSQFMVSALEEQDSPYHHIFSQDPDLAGLPVMVLDLHSQLPAVLAGIRSLHPNLNITYIWTDDAALPAFFSRSLAQLKTAGWITRVITAGQAFGGDFEAINVASALQAAAEIFHSDLVIVGQGPGNAGTGTALGYSGLENASVLTMSTLLGANVYAPLRISAADRRDRHFGVSHHSLTLLSRFVPLPVTIPWPLFPRLQDFQTGKEAFLSPEDQAALIPLNTQMFQEKLQFDQTKVGSQHRIVPVPTVDPDTNVQLLTDLRQVPVRLSTMGRDLDQDAALFLAAAAAGRLAASEITAKG